MTFIEANKTNFFGGMSPTLSIYKDFLEKSFESKL